MNRTIHKPTTIVFASGGEGANEGASGLKVLKQQELAGNLQTNITTAISQNPTGGTYSKTQELGINFIYLKDNKRETYKQILKDTKAELVLLSGHTLLVKEIPPNIVINIHPGPLGKYGGKGMYGDTVHTAIYEDLKKGEINRTCVTMHFATPTYDDPQGLIFQYPVELKDDKHIMELINDEEKCIAAIKAKVNKVEHERQRQITNMVANKEITATRDEETQKIQIQFPQDYQWNIPVALDKENPYENL